MNNKKTTKQKDLKKWTTPRIISINISNTATGSLPGGTENITYYYT